MARKYLFATLAFLAAAAPTVSQVALADDKEPPKRTITMSGKGTVKSAPDKVTVSAGVESQAPTANDALAKNTAAMTKVVDALKSAGIDPKDIQTTDFSVNPTDGSGVPIANRVAANKRPRSSMAPTLVFKTAADGTRGDFYMGTGSPGGSTIIQYVVKTLVGVLDWNLEAQQATSLVDFGAANSPTTNVGGEHPNVNATSNGAGDPLVTGLRAMGHTVSVSAQSSGISTIVRVPSNGTTVLAGGADPRREGVVLGDVITP